MPSHSWRAAVLATALLTTLGAAPALADSAARTPARGDRTAPPAARSAPSDDEPERVLPDQMRGRSAVKALGNRIKRVAASNGLTAPELEELLTEDHTVWLSTAGKVYYREDAPEEASGGESGVTALAALTPAYSTSKTFALSSKPGASRTIFLDFNGATVENTNWNTGNGGTIDNGTHIGWDSDGVPSKFNSSEHGWIQEVWREVAEAYAPMDVNVTTQDPGQAAWTRTSSSDTHYGTRVVITSSKDAKSQACGTCLGIAWLGTFSAVDRNALYQPAWVFADNPSMAPMVVAQAASHETGHTLSLSHDGVGVQDYYAGTAGWGPLMGSSRTRAVSQFSMGEYAGANQKQDDFAVMQSNGLPPRVDDHGSTTAAANNLGALTSYAANGIISTRTDQDVFAINLPCTTDLTVNANGIGAQTTLDLSLAVLDGAGRSVATASPTSSYSGSPPVSNGMNASVTVRGATGTYYLRVDGVGNGLAESNGWSDYGSLGQFRLTANGCPNVASPPASPQPTPNPTPKPASTQNVTAPSAPVIKVASAGKRGGKSTAIARWAAPTRTGGAAVTKYRVRALRLNNRNRVVRVVASAYLGPSARALTMRLPKARYTFSVMAWNRVGASTWSRSSGVVRAR